MTDSQAKLKWIRGRFFKREHKKIFLLGRAKDLSARIYNACQAGEYLRAAEFTPLLSAVCDEMLKLQMMVEVENYLMFLPMVDQTFLRPNDDDDPGEGF